MPFTMHLRELRAALIRVIVVLIILASGAFFFAEEIYQILLKPLAAIATSHSLKIVVISPLEQAFTYLKTALFTAIILALPYLLGEIWHFIAPALKQNEKRFIFPIISLGTLLFLSGTALSYFFLLPFAMEAIIAWLPETIEATISMERYFAVALQLLLGFGLVFETPLIVAMLIISGLISPERLSKWRRVYVVLAFIIAALCTPADPISQVAMAIPLCLFFELGLILGRILKKNESKE